MDNVRRHPSAPPADDDALTQAVPHDPDAEAYVCGIIMHSAQAYTDCAEIISREDICLAKHRLIWDTVAGMVAAGTALHPVTVKAEIGRQKRLREVADGAYIDALGTTTITAAMAPSFAEQIAETARLRRHQEHALRIRAAIARGDTATELDDLQQEFVHAEEKRATTGNGPSHLTGALLDWDAFFATDFGKVELLPGKLLAPGQQITLVGDGKAGKSLFTQEWMWRTATGQGFLGDRPQAPISVLYIDAENGQEQIQERFASFGAGPGRMGMLSYASFPPVRPLDTPGGGADLLALARSVEARLVVIDTISRFISGPENDADTWLALYRHTLLPLKRDGVASVRLDHRGKDAERGARGSSAKTQDVDHVWDLSAQGGGTLVLKRTHTRTGIGPDDFVILRQAQRDGDAWREGGTRHVLMTFDAEPGVSGLAAVPGTVEHLVATLDQAGVPTGWGAPRVSRKLAELGVRVAKAKIEEAVKIRKARPAQTGTGDVYSDTQSYAQPSLADERGQLDAANVPNDLPRPLPPSTFNQPPPESGGGHHKTPGQTSPGEVGGTLPAPREGTSPLPPPSREGGGPGDPGDPTTPACTICTRRLDADAAARGHTTHHKCAPPLPTDNDQED